MKDPRLSDLATHLKILDSKLNSGLQTIEDFEYLLVETKQEISSQNSLINNIISMSSSGGNQGITPPPNQCKEILNTLLLIEQALNEQKQVFLQIQQRKQQAKTRIEHVNNLISSQSFGKVKRQNKNTGAGSSGINDVMSASSSNEGQNTQTIAAINFNQTSPTLSNKNHDSDNTSTLTPGEQLLRKYERQTYISGNNHSSEQDIKTQIECIYKSISDMIKYLRRGEEEAQIQMLKWENFVIQHEKMQKLREDKAEQDKTQKLKIEDIQDQEVKLKAMITYFNKICSIIESTCCQVNDGSNIFQNPRSTCNSHDESSFDLGRQSSSIFQDSFEDEEKECEMNDLGNLKQLLAKCSKRCEQGEKSLQKQIQKLNELKTKRLELNEFDIYELDSYQKESQDINNKLEITLYRLQEKSSELQSNYHDGYHILEVCEKVMLRQQELYLCERLLKHNKKLCNSLLKNDQLTSNNNSQTGAVIPNQSMSRFQLNIRKYQEQIEECKQSIERISKIQELNLGDLEQIESIMVLLTQIHKDCNDVTKNVFDDGLSIIKQFVMLGGFGFRVNISSLQTKYQTKIEKVKKSMLTLNLNLSTQLQDIRNLNPLKQIELNTSSDETQNVKHERINARTQRLIEKHKILFDQMLEIEQNLERWAETQNVASMSIIEDQDLNEQDWLVQEFINVLTQIFNLKYFHMKLEESINHNQRQIYVIMLEESQTQSQTKLLNITQILDQATNVCTQLDQILRQRQSLSLIFQNPQNNYSNIHMTPIDNKVNSGATNSIEISNINYANNLKLVDGMDEHQKNYLNYKNLLGKYFGMKEAYQAMLNKNQLLLKEKLQLSIKEYKTLFSDEETLQKTQSEIFSLERKLSDLQKQCRTLNNDINEIFIHYQKQEGSQASQNYGMNFNKSNSQSFNFKQDQASGIRSSSMVNESFSSQVSKSFIKDVNQQNLLTNQTHIDDLDQALFKSIEDQKCFRNMKITKISSGVYQLENRQYKFKLMPGNNLAIRMYAGYILVDCLVHFDEELMHLIL
eukprot:403336261